MLPNDYVAEELDGVNLDMKELGKRSRVMAMLRVGRHSDVPKAPFPMCFTREAMSDFLRSVGARPPESGAKGFGPVDRIGFDQIEFDEEGSASAGGAVYSPDVEWGRRRCEYHLNQTDPETRVWTGDLHSHPGGYGRPSPAVGKGLGDLGYTKEVFEWNEAMEWFFMPIATGTGPGQQDVVLHPWVVRRDGTLFIAELKICPASEFPVREFNPEWLNRIEVAPTQEGMEEDLEYAIVAYDEGGTFAGRTRTSADAVAPRAESAARRSARESNSTAATSNKATGVNTGDRVVRRPSSTSAVPSNEEIAARSRQRVRELYTARLEGIVSPSFHARSVGIVGVGAGSYMVEKLGRLSPRRLKICDFDVIEVPNLVRTCYSYADAVLRRRKVVALARRLEEVNPLVRVSAYAQSITAMSEDALDEFFDGLDLVVAGTDQFSAQELINEEAVRRGIPAVFIGIHAGALGGRVIWTVPGDTPCYRCVARERFEAVEHRSSAPDLPAALGAIVDCQFVDTIALKMVLACLEKGQDSVMGRFFQRVAGRNDIIIRCDPTYEWGNAMWDAVLADLPISPKPFAQELKEAALFAMDSLWLRSDFDPNCPVCRGNRHEAILESR